MTCYNTEVQLVGGMCHKFLHFLNHLSIDTKKILILLVYNNISYINCLLGLLMQEVVTIIISYLSIKYSRLKITSIMFSCKISLTPTVFKKIITHTPKF